MRGVIYARYSEGPRQTDQSIEGQVRPEEYEKIGIDPRYADILRLTVIDAPKISKKKYKEFCKEMKNDDILKRKPIEEVDHEFSKIEIRELEPEGICRKGRRRK